MIEQATLFDSSAAAAEALRGMELAERAARVQAWKETADLWLQGLAPGSIFTADDLVAALGLPDPSAGPARNNVVGAWTGSRARRRRIIWTGELRKSERVIGHGNLQRVWRVT